MCVLEAALSVVYASDRHPEIYPQTAATVSSTPLLLTAMRLKISVHLPTFQLHVPSQQAPMALHPTSRDNGPYKCFQSGGETFQPQMGNSSKQYSLVRDCWSWNQVPSALTSSMCE